MKPNEMTTREQLISRELARTDGAMPGSGLSKHRKMCASPFVFYRGACQLFYADIAQDKLSLPDTSALPLTNIMGDCHTSNFGFFTAEGSHGEDIVFSLNDFDDACIGHGLWDIVRYLVSLCLVGDHCQGLESGRYAAQASEKQKPAVTDEHVQQAMSVFLDTYRLALRNIVESKGDCSLYLQQEFTDFTTPSALKKRYKKAQQVVLGGERFTTKSALAKAVKLDSSPLQFDLSNGKFEALPAAQFSHLRTTLSPYFYQSVLDVCARLGAGTGSVNMARYYALIGPRNPHDKDYTARCHVVEIKQQRQAAAIHYFPDLHPQNRLSPAHLTVKCQRRMQLRVDYVLDDVQFDGHHWLIRSRHHAKVGIDPEHIGLGKVNTEQDGLAFYAGACAEELARAHSRGDRFSTEYEEAYLQYLTLHHSALIQLARAYARQVIADWQCLCAMEGCHPSH